MDRKLQRHRADSLRQHGFLVFKVNGSNWFIWQALTFLSRLPTAWSWQSRQELAKDRLSSVEPVKRCPKCCAVRPSGPPIDTSETACSTFMTLSLQTCSASVLLFILRDAIRTVWVKKSHPYGFLKFFPKRLGIFKQFFTHLLYYHFYTRLQIFIQISPTLTKLCPKRDHLANFYISLEL